jgi:hypothetical protein
MERKAPKKISKKTRPLCNRSYGVRISMIERLSDCNSEPNSINCDELGSDQRDAEGEVGLNA